MLEIKNAINISIIKYGFIVICLVGVTVLVLINDSDLITRLFYTTDRMELMQDVLSYVKERPLIGYGNSYDVLYHMFDYNITQINWGHAHNTVLELLLRSGSVGLIFYSIFIWSVGKDIKDIDDKVLFWLFWLLSLFQIYFKCFIFILFIVLLIPDKSNAETIENGEMST